MAETLKDFLVSIGFKVDDTSQKRAEAAVARTEKQSTKVTEVEAAKRVRVEILEIDKRERARRESAKKEGERQRESLKGIEAYAVRASSLMGKAFLAVEATALGVVAAVDKAAKSYDRLNFMAQRVGAKPGSIGAFGYATSQLGGSVDSANASLEAIGQRLRIYKEGYRQSLERAGVKTRNANGSFRDVADIATDLGDALRRTQQNGGASGYTQAIALASSFGIDEMQARALMSPDFRNYEAQYRSDQAKIGLDPNRAAAEGSAFERSKTHVEQQISNIGDKVTSGLFKDLQPQLDRLSKWLDEHGDKVADIIGRIAKDITDLGIAILTKIANLDWDAILSHVEGFAKGFDGLAKRLTGRDGLTLAFEGLGAVLALRVLPRLLGVAGALRAITAVGILPPWLLAMLVGGGAATYAAGKAVDYAVDKDQEKAGVTAMQAQMDLQKHHLSVRSGAQKAWGWVKGKFGGDDGHVTGNDAVWARTPQAKRARRAAAGYTGTEASAKPTKGGWWTPERQKHAYDVLRANGVSERGAIALISRWKNVESTGRGPDAINPTSGAYGIEQGLGSRKPHTNDFDAQLVAAARETKTGDGGGSGRIFDSAQDDREAARGASVHERAEGWNGYTDNFQARTLAGMEEVRRNVLGKAPPLAAAPPMPGPGVPQGFKGGGYAALGLGPDGRPVRPLGDTPALHHSITSSTRGDQVINHTQTFNITGSGVGSGPAMLEAARRTASRGQQDLLRNVQGASQ